MRILLLGDFSGMHTHLGVGLRDLGHEVTVASSGDGWKRLPNDISLGIDDPNIFRKIERNLKPFALINRLTGFDVVQFQNPVVFPWRFGVNAWMMRRVAASSGRVFLSAAGDDAFFWRHARNELGYGPFDDFLKFDLKADRYFWETERMYRWNLELVRLVRGVIPVAYEYWLGYCHCPKVSPTIPLPVDCQALSYEENRVTGRIRILHGLNREGFKGSRFIREALNRIEDEYRDQVEVLYVERLRFSEYLQTLRTCHVLVDQALSHSWGLNAILALAMGKVVLSGAEPEALRALGIDETPVINIPPDVGRIRQIIERLIHSKETFPALGRRGREFAENLHDCRNVARRYLDAWSG